MRDGCLSVLDGGQQPRIGGAPATYNTINKWSAGIADTYVLTPSGITVLFGEGGFVPQYPWTVALDAVRP